MIRSPRRFALAALAILFVEACSFLKPHTDPTKFFVLTVAAPPTPPAPVAIVVGLDRVELPEYLDRLELATRLASNELQFAEFDQWGEPVKDGFVRTLRRDLVLRLGEGHVVAPPFDPSSRPDVTVEVAVRRFERVAEGGAVLDASWTINDGKSGAALVTKESHVQKPIATNDSAATVAALSQALGTLAGEIADGIRLRDSAPISIAK